MTGPQTPGHTPQPLGPSLAAQKHRHERRVSVAELLDQHLSTWAISEKLNVAHTTVCRDVATIRRWYQDRAVDSYQKVLAVEIRKLDDIERAFTPLVLGTLEPDPAAALVLFRAMDRRHRLLGLEAPRRVDATIHHEHGPTPLEAEIAELFEQMAGKVPDAIPVESTVRAIANGDSA